MNWIQLLPVVVELINALGINFETFRDLYAKDLDPDVLAQIKAGYDERIAAREAEQRRLDG